MPTLHPDAEASTARKNQAKMFEGKAAAKAALQEHLGWLQEPKAPLLCLPSGMTDDLGGALLKELLPGLLGLPTHIVILGKGSATYGTLFTHLSKEYPHRVAILPSKENVIRAMEAAADMALFLTDADTAAVRSCLKSGTVPIAPTSPHLKNYNPNQESGTAFTYEEASIWGVYAALVRALETFRFPFDWKTIQRQCIERS